MPVSRLSNQVFLFVVISFVPVFAIIRHQGYSQHRELHRHHHRYHLRGHHLHLHPHQVNGEDSANKSVKHHSFGDKSQRDERVTLGNVTKPELLTSGFPVPGVPGEFRFNNIRSLIDVTSGLAGSEAVVWPVKKEAVLEGDVILGGLMMVHEREDSVTCGPIMPQGGIQALETMMYTLDVINSQRLLPFSLGAHVLDDCDKDTYGLEMAVDFIKGTAFKEMHLKLRIKLYLYEVFLFYCIII